MQIHKNCFRNFSVALRRLALATLTILALAYTHTVRADEDLIIDGTTMTIPGGTYRMVVVKNNGTLIVNGATIAAQEIYVTNATMTASNVTCATLVVDGTFTAMKNLTCVNATFNGPAGSVFGTNNRISNLIIRGRLTTLGVWNIGHLTVSSNGTLKVQPLNGNYPLSGTIIIHCLSGLIEVGGHIDATNSGNDSRGQGLDWYRSATGGSHIGQGGRGYWNSSADGLRAPYGSAITYEVFMGGAAGAAYGLNYGGASVFFEAENLLTIAGDIVANGNNGLNNYFGGGAGGSILLRSPLMIITGQLSANGGNGGYYGGGGGGGPIKVFYGNSSMGSLTGHTSVNGGSAGGYLNTQNGGAGIVYRDYIPKVDNLVAPAANAAVPNGIVTFTFSLVDESGALDGHTDSLTPRIELSTDGFETLAFVFDQHETLTGWDKVAYYSGDTASYTTQSPLPEGVYGWRVTLRDQSLWSRPTIPRTLIVGNDPPNQTLTASMVMTPTVVINAAVGTRCSVEYTDTLGVGALWRTLSIVPIETKPQLYFDTTGTSIGARFYRLQQVP